MNEQLKAAHTKIKDLEAALSETQGGASHPLLREAAAAQDLQRPDSPELGTIYDDGVHHVSEAIGSLALGPDGTARYHGETAGSEVRFSS